MLNPQADFLTREYLPLAFSIAVSEWRKCSSKRSLDDIHSSAVYGLVDAASRWEKYCEDRGFDNSRLDRFKVYASKRILGEIIEGYRRSNSITRTQLKAYQTVRDAGIQLPRSEQVEKTGMSTTAISRAISILVQEYQYSSPEDESSISGTESSALVNYVNEKILDLIKGMSFEARVVLALRYFIKFKTKQIAEALDLREVEVMKIHAQAVTSIHNEAARLIGFS